MEPSLGVQDQYHKYENGILRALPFCDARKETRQGRSERLRLTEDELAFYDALETNDSAVQVLGDETVRYVVRQLVEAVCSNVTIDWTLREDVTATSEGLFAAPAASTATRRTSRNKGRRPCWNKRKCCCKDGPLSEIP